MKKYLITIQVEHQVHFELEAESYDEAYQKGNDLWDAHGLNEDGYPVEVDNVSVDLFNDSVDAIEL